MRILIMGRPPGRDWRLPPSSDVVVCGEGVPEATWYQAVPVPDLTDLEQVLYALTHAGRVAFDAVYCDFEHAMVNASMVASFVGASQSLSPRTALLGRDKLLQKQVVSAAGIPTAKVEMVPLSGPERERFVPSGPYPLIVKPALGSATRNVRRVGTPAEAAAAIAAVGEREPALCETFVEGRECHIDAVLVDGELRLLSVAHYLSNVIDTGAARPTGSCVVPAAGNEELYDRAEELVLACRAAFGLTDGVLHLEAFDHDGTLVYSECGFRRAGAKVPQAVTLATDCDYRELACLASLRLLPPAPTVRPLRATAWVMVTAGPGYVESMPDDDRFATVHGLEHVSLRRELVGSYVGERSGPYDNAGFLLLSGAETEAVRGEAERAAGIFRTHTVVTTAPGPRQSAQHGNRPHEHLAGAR